MPQQPKPWEPGASTRQKVAPLIAAVVLVAAIVYSLLPFTFAGAVECSAPLRGSTAAPDTPAGTVLGNPDEACAASGGTRLVNAAVVGAAAVVLGLAGAFLPSDRDVDRSEGGEDAASGGGTG